MPVTGSPASVHGCPRKQTLRGSTRGHGDRHLVVVPVLLSELCFPHISCLSETGVNGYCPFSQGNDMYGQSVGPLGIRVADMTDEVFDYVFLQTDELPKTTPIPTEHLQVSFSKRSLVRANLPQTCAKPVRLTPQLS